jgi:hypothetical protein
MSGLRILPAVHLALAAAIGFCVAVHAVGFDEEIPPPPDWSHYTDTIRETLTHGMQLLASGDFEFAEGHFRGAKPRNPMYVYINANGAPRQFRRRCWRAAQEAMDVWNSAAAKLVNFVEIDREERADVVIQFEYDVADRENGQVRYVCGKCLPTAPHDGKRIEPFAVIRVAVYCEGDGSAAHSSASLIHVVAHELGHTLGLGESAHKGDIMGPDDHQGAPATQVSADDLRRLRALAALSDQLLAIAGKKETIVLPKPWEPPRRKPAMRKTK